jgi:type IV secretion system protein VirB3
MNDNELGAIRANDPFFKGCTKPAMFAQVPLIPMLTVTGVFLVLAMWTLIFGSAYLALFLIMVYLPIYAAMRAMSRKDDQRLHQMMLRARMRTRHRNRTVWGAISYCPLRLAKRK